MLRKRDRRKHPRVSKQQHQVQHTKVSQVRVIQNCEILFPKLDNTFLKRAKTATYRALSGNRENSISQVSGKASKPVLMSGRGAALRICLRFLLLQIKKFKNNAFLLLI